MGCELCGRDGVVHPLVALCMHIELGAEGLFVGLAFGALVHQRTLCAGEGCRFFVALNEILANLRAHKFQHVAHVADDGVVA